MKIHADAMNDLAEPLKELGRRWATSQHRPKPKPVTLAKWDAFLETWLKSDLPLILRDSRRRSEITASANGRKIIFADNTPANWMFGLALRDEVPDLSGWTLENIKSQVPLTFLSKGTFARHDLNKDGWKVCHFKKVSDGKRYKVEEAPIEILEAEFKRFLSPKNVFLVPKEIAGAGELKEIIAAIVAFDKEATCEDEPAAQHQE